MYYLQHNNILGTYLPMYILTYLISFENIHKMSNSSYGDNASLSTLVDCLISNADYFFPGGIEWIYLLETIDLFVLWLHFFLMNRFYDGFRYQIHQSPNFQSHQPNWWLHRRAKLLCVSTII